MRRILLFIVCLLASHVTFSQTARLQVIHNSPTPTVDIYVNGDLLLDDFVFRTATPFIDVPADVDLEVGVALGNSTSAADVLVNFDYNLADGGSYILVANGIVGGNPGFNLEVFDMGQEIVAPDNVGILFFHGSPDAPEVDIVIDGNPIFDDVAFGEFSGYLEVSAAEYKLGVTPADDNTNVLAEYKKDFDFWKGQTAVVFASGFLNGSDPGFEPWVALSNGGTFPLDFVAPDIPTARIQVIHNSPGSKVDVYLNDEKILDDFVFRTATPFLDVPANVNLEVVVASENSISSADGFAAFQYNLTEDQRYIIVANGVPPGNIAFNLNTAFNLEVFDMAQETVSDENVGILFFNGAPNGPEVDLLVDGNPFFDNVAYGEFFGYLEASAEDFIFSLTPSNDNSNLLEKYSEDFNFWKGQTLVIFTSGFFSGVFPSLETWAALSNGGTFPLNVLHNIVAPNTNTLHSINSGGTLETYPNPARDFLNIKMDLEKEATVEIAIYNNIGQQVAQKNFGEMYEGENLMEMNTDKLGSGIYLLQIRMGEEFSSQLVHIIK